MDEGLLNDVLECSVCLERLDMSSRVLPCQHTFCLQCLREIVYSQKELRCPECRFLVETPVEELPPNVLLMRILEGMRNSGYQKPPSSSPPPQLIPRRPVIGPATFMEPVCSYGFTYSDGDGKHTNVIPKCTPHARAVYDYFSKEPGDLSFKKGEVIILRRQIDTYWFHGETGRNQGAFPITYAKIIVPLPSPSPHCIAQYDFHMAAPDEEGCLSFQKGAVINVIRRVDENWAEGRLNNKIGIFPIAFVEMNASALDIINDPTNIPPSVERNPATNQMVKSVPRTTVGSITNKSLHSFVQKHPQHSTFAPNQVSYQQQMVVSSPVPNLGISMQRQQQHMSQSHPAYMHQHQVHRTQEPAPSASPYIDVADIQSIGQLRNLHIDSQASERTKQTNISLEVRGQLNAPHLDPNLQNMHKVKADGSKFSNLTSSYHATNNLSSDSSSTTTTPSFGGSSVTTTPNTSSSNTSSASESNTPSSPASPTSNLIQPKSNIAIANNVPISQIAQNSNCIQVSNQSLTPLRNSIHGNSSREDCDTTICETTLNPENSVSSAASPLINAETSFRSDVHQLNNSPMQNLNGSSSNATPPRSNMSSPQVCLGSQSIQPSSLNSSLQHDNIQFNNNQSNINKNASPSQNMLGSHVVSMSSNVQGNPFINMQSSANIQSNIHSDGQSNKNNPTFNVMDLLPNERLPYTVSSISPRHSSKDGTPRSSHSHHREKEKRHSLTPMSQNLMVTNSSTNRHSAEILGSTSGSLLDQSINQDLSKHSDRDKRIDRERNGKESGDKAKDREREKSKKSLNPDKSPLMTYVALYPYKPQKPDELELKKGGLYMVIEQCQDGWFKGCSSRTKKFGVFPGNYVALASKNIQLSSSSKSKHHNPSNDNLVTSSPNSSKNKDNISNVSSSSRKCIDHSQIPVQPPDLPPRSQSPGASHSCNRSSPKSSKSSDKKEKNKSEKNSSSGISLMKRLTGMKKSRSPPPANSSFSMDNPVFEDCTSDSFSPAINRDMNLTVSQHPVHIRSGSCPSQLLQGQPVNTIKPQLQNMHHYPNESMLDSGVFSSQLSAGGSVSSAVAHRLFPSHHIKGSGSQTLGPAHGAGLMQRRQPRPTVLHTLTGTSDATATLGANSGKQGYTTGRGSDQTWSGLPTQHYHHRKSHSLDAGQQLRSGKENTNQPVGKRFRCVVAYPPNSEYELELQVDDVVLVHKKLGEGWYKGTLERTGHTGLVPASFVEAC